METLYCYEIKESLIKTQERHKTVASCIDQWGPYDEGGKGSQRVIVEFS